jgi:hypothetical protein
VACHMHTFAAAGAAFLLAVLWFDLMFDVQSRKRAGDRLPTEILASISAYYPAPIVNWPRTGRRSGPPGQEKKMVVVD